MLRVGRIGLRNEPAVLGEQEEEGGGIIVLGVQGINDSLSRQVDAKGSDSLASIILERHRIGRDERAPGFLIRVWITPAR